MRYKYYATFAAGMQYIVKDILESRIKDLKIHQLFDGAVLFETEKTYDRLNMFCFNNIFYVIAFENNMSDNIEYFIKHIISSQFGLEQISNKKNNTFRVIISLENKLVSIDNRLKFKLENYISLKSKLKINKSKSDTEFWILYRNEGFFYFLKRLSSHTAYEKILKKGELHPEIAFLINWFAEPDKNDIFLDPFCGYGSIPLSRALHFPAKQIYAFDIDKDMIQTVKPKIKNNKTLANMQNISIKQIDIEKIDNELSNECIDKIVTDPPWGLYRNNINDIEKFYMLILSKMEKVLKHDGIIVMLVGRNIDIANILKNIPNLQLKQNYNVLISGKKSNIVKIKKLSKLSLKGNANAPSP